MVDSAPPAHERPAAHLQGLTLSNGWVVVAKENRPEGSTGGHFSVPYRVRRKAEEGFLKALDLRSTLEMPGSLVDNINAATAAFQFERDLLLDCGQQRLSRIIRLLDHGEAVVAGAGPLSRVPYLVFELADGDIRAFQAAMGRFDAAWAMRTMKHASLGLEQLHGVMAAHQDLKPSNILTQDSGREMKLGDLGRADRSGVDGPCSDMRIPGAFSYAPPEQLYRAFGKTWEERKAADMYLLGSVGVHLILRSSMTALLKVRLPSGFGWLEWQGSFRDVLPYLRHAHGTVIEDLRGGAAQQLPDLAVVGDYANAVSQLTDPDPDLRGHPRDRAAHTSSYSLRRYVSLFNRLAARLEAGYGKR